MIQVLFDNKIYFLLCDNLTVSLAPKKNSQNKIEVIIDWKVVIKHYMEIQSGILSYAN